jgi:lysophospholipase L1-like esterase
MRTALGTFLLALATATGTLVALPGPAAQADGVTRIMLAGDSITQGFDGDFTWRYRLYQELTRQQVSFDFVGPRDEPYGGHDAYLASGWDTDHDAQGGTTLNAQLGNITADMTTYQPDVVVALYGTNDLHNGASPEELMARWRSYVEKVRAVNPTVTLILGETYAEIATGHAQANDLLNALAAELNTDESPVRVADLDNPELILSRDTYDHTHPTPTGETLIAQKVADSLHLQGIVPSTPQIAQAHVAWTPPLKAAVHRVGHRLRMDWAASKHRYRAREARVRWTNVRTGRSTTTRWRRWPARVTTPPLAPGRWRVQVQASRRTMTATWGPAVVRRIPRG